MAIKYDKRWKVILMGFVLFGPMQYIAYLLSVLFHPLEFKVLYGIYLGIWFCRIGSRFKKDSGYDF